MAAEAEAANGETVQEKEEKEMKNAQIKEAVEDVASPVSEAAEHDKLLEDSNDARDCVFNRVINLD